MKQLFLALVIVGASLSKTFAQEATPLPLIHVTGSAEVKVAPDEIFLSVGVESRHAMLDDAKRDNDERVAQALAFLKRTDVPARNIQTDYINVQPVYEDSNYRHTNIVSHFVRRSIEIKLTKIGDFEAVLTGLLTNGVSHVHGVDFRTSDLRKHRDEARAMAIRAARDKADALSAELGTKRGKVHTIRANDSWWGSYGNYWGDRHYRWTAQNLSQVSSVSVGETEDSALSIGQISVSATVDVAFVIE